MDREQLVKRLVTYCSGRFECAGCKIENDSRGCALCRGNTFYKMTDEELEYLAHVAEIDESAPDMVNEPPHYTQGNIECIDAIRESMTPLEYAGFLKGQVIKYLWRYRLKGKLVEDLKKADYYQKKLIEFAEAENRV